VLFYFNQTMIVHDATNKLLKCAANLQQQQKEQLGAVVFLG
jgi:hypothetical protein